MRFAGTCYRAHDPRWAFKPISGAGAAVHGGRFNPRGTEALYLALSLIGAVNEAAQGFAFKLQPMVLCSYDADIDGIAGLLVPSYAPGASRQDCNSVLWRWGEAQVRVYDPSGRLPKDQPSWQRY